MFTFLSAQLRLEFTTILGFRDDALGKAQSDSSRAYLLTVDAAQPSLQALLPAWHGCLGQSFNSDQVKLEGPPRPWEAIKITSHFCFRGIDDSLIGSGALVTTAAKGTPAGAQADVSATGDLASDPVD
ncbi:MAG: hypothetical protein HY661_11675 [Betaproteobacteria bacterium]|nr:hypothetical protein [Betaproteobacteria bacterium]